MEFLKLVTFSSTAVAIEDSSGYKERIYTCVRFLELWHSRSQIGNEIAV